MSKKYLPLLTLTPLIVFLDQLTKYFVVRDIPRGQMRSVIDGFFEIVHVRNPGAAFGFLSGWNSDHRTWFFYGISTLAILVILWIYRQSTAGERGLHLPLAAILGGAFGNLIDRIRFGNVVDFLHFHWRDKVWQFDLFGKHFAIDLSWPSFNVADAAISVSAVYLAIRLLRSDKKKI